MRSAAKYIWIVLVVAFIGGYLLLDTSGLLGTQLVTPGTAVGEVNGTEITYGAWIKRANDIVERQEQQTGRSVDPDERAMLEDQAFEDLVMEVLLREEFERRGVRVSDEDIISAARFSPPPELMESPELQTDGRFDPQKWQRFLASPSIRQQGFLTQLEQYYRTELPRAKFYRQLASEVYASDPRLWRLYQDERDSASISYVAFRPAPGAVSFGRYPGASRARQRS